MTSAFSPDLTDIENAVRRAGVGIMRVRDRLIDQRNRLSWATIADFWLARTRSSDVAPKVRPPLFLNSASVLLCESGAR